MSRQAVLPRGAYVSETGARTAVLPSGEYLSESASASSNAVEDGWDWDTEAVAEDEAFVIEATVQSQPVDLLPNASMLGDDLFDEQYDGYDDPIIDMAEALGPVQPQAPPADSVLSDEWRFDDDELPATSIPESYQQTDQATPTAPAFDDSFDWDELAEDLGIFDEPTQDAEPYALGRDAEWIDETDSDELFDESAPVIADAPTNVALNIEDPWAHYDEFDHDDWQEEQAPVGQDAGFVPPAIVDDAWDWFEPVDDEIVDVDRIADAGESPFDDAWDVDETVEDVFDESAPVADAIQDPPRDDAWDWDETLEEFFDDWSLSPDAPLNPLLNAEDQWPWFDEFADDHWQEENAPTITGAVVVIFNPLRGYIVSGQDRRFIANGEDRRFVVIGQDRRYIVRLPT